MSSFILTKEIFLEKSAYKNNKVFCSSPFLEICLDFSNYIITDLIAQKKSEIILTNEKLETLAITLAGAYLAWYESKCKEEEYKIITSLKTEIYKIYGKPATRVAGGRL